MYHLIVVHEFGNYAKGQKITDPDEVAAILASHNHTGIVKIPASDEEERPAAKDAPAKDAPEWDHL